MALHLLKDVQVRNAKPKDRPYRLLDGDGLYLCVSPSGVKAWQYRYKLDGKGQTLTLGKIERMSLMQARKEADDARKRAAEGEHLTLLKREKKAKKKTDRDNTFATVAANWVKREARRVRWSADYRAEVEASLRNHLSELDKLPVSRITAPVVAPILSTIESNAPMMLEKARRRLHAILDSAVEHGMIPHNPLPVARRGVKGERRHFPAVTDLAGLGAILRAARASDPCKGVARAHVLLAFAAQRVSEVVGATWAEFELDGVDVPIGEGQHTKHDPTAGDWSIPRERMKRKDEARGPHIVPLPPVLLATLREWREADGVSAVYVCPAPRDPSRPITPEAVEKFYRNALGLGGKHSPHSWRSAFSTVAREAGKDGDAVESQLDHVVGIKVASAYDRAKRVELRRQLMTWYEQTLIAARDGAAVLELTRGRRGADVNQA